MQCVEISIMSEPLHRMNDSQLPQVLSLLAAGGGTRRTAESWKQDGMTALLLGPQGSPTAAMPMARRGVQVSPGRVLKAGWISSNQFASRMGLRRQTRGTAGRWAELLPELDALLVVRREDSSVLNGAARWYSRAGFHDVLAVRCLYLDMTEPPAGGAGANRYSMQVISPEHLASGGGAWANQMAGVYRDVFGNYGGAVMRGAGFWQPAITHHFYREHYQFQVIGLFSGAGASEQLVGYAIVGWSGWHSRRPRMDILELATRQWDTSIAQELIRTTCQLAWSKNVSQVRAVVSVHDPYRPYLARVGFADMWGYVMAAKWLNPQRYLDSIVSNAEAGAGEIEISVPGQVPVTFRGNGGGEVLRVKTDARTMTRLLLQRVEVSAAIQEGSLVSSAGEPARISMAFPWTPWVFHMLDYI
jgi:hypothetical protein